MKSIRLQLLVTLLATSVAAGMFINRGLPPSIRFHDAAFSGDVEEAGRALNWGVGVVSRSEYTWTPLHYAILLEESRLVGRFIAAGAEVNACDGRAWTPLHVAAVHGYSDIVQLLLASGADVSAKTKDGETPLHLAARRGNSASVELLLKHESDVHVRNQRGRTPLHSVCARERGGPFSSFRVWLSKGGGAELYSDWSAVHVGPPQPARPPMGAADFEGVAALLLAAGADVNAVCKQEGRTPLQCAVSMGRRDTVPALVAAGADVNAKDTDGKTPLAMAIKKGRNDVADLLRRHGARE